MFFLLLFEHELERTDIGKYYLDMKMEKDY